MWREREREERWVWSGLGLRYSNIRSKHGLNTLWQAGPLSWSPWECFVLNIPSKLPLTDKDSSNPKPLDPCRNCLSHTSTLYSKSLLTYGMVCVVLSYGMVWYATVVLR